MKPRTICLVVGISLFAHLTFGEGIIEKFAKESVAVDLQCYPFGMELDQRFHRLDTRQTARETYLGPQLPPLIATKGEEALEWYRNEASTNYAKSFSNRNLVFGFKNGRLAAIRISFASFFDKAPARVREAKRDLLRVQADLMNSTQHKWNFDDGRLRIFYAALCSSLPEDLFCSTIQIMPVEKTP